VTVNSEYPYVNYTGNGRTIDYSFKWSSGDPTEIYVELNQVALKVGVEYELSEYDAAHGGIITFNTVPAVNDAIYIYRDTPVTQQLDLVEGEPFPMDMIEFSCDKDTRILQEIIEGGRALGGRVDLEAIQYPTYVEITNTSGNNAILQPWTTDGLLAGIFMGEVIPNGDPSKPSDTDPTDQPNGYIWWYLGPEPSAGGNPSIKMHTNSIAVNTALPIPYSPRAEFRYDAVTGLAEWGYNKSDPLVEPVWTTDVALNPVPTVPATFWIRFEVQVGSVLEDLDSPIDTWIDAAQLAGTPNQFASWYVNLGGSAQAIFTVAPDDGFGSPDMDFAISRYVTLSAVQT
jgi:hypothetical protein